MANNDFNSPNFPFIGKQEYDEPELVDVNLISDVDHWKFSEDLSTILCEAKKVKRIEFQKGTEVENAMIFEKKDIEITPTNVSAVNHLKECVQYHKSEGEKRQFICRICSKSCKRKDLLTKHEKIHTERKTQFICKICSKSCKRRELLTKHEKIHIGKKSFHCKLCSKSFLKRGNLVVHERLHTGEKPFLCKICCTSFRQLAHLKCHERTHSGENPVVCKFCLKLFANGDQLKDHEKIHSEIPQLVNRFDEDNPNIYEENMEGDLKILEKDIHEVNIKDKPTSKDVDERDITLDEKPSLELIPGIELQQVTEIDDAKTSKELDMKITPSNISNDTSYLTGECNKNFVGKNEFIQHEKVEKKGKQFHCKICSISCKSKMLLRRHEKIHTGIKPFSCGICNKTFRRKSDLVIHNRIHTGEKPFGCKICSRSFKTSTHLKNHLIIHSGAKPFVCKFCSKSFTARSYLNDHERIHTEKPFSCKFCPKLFYMLRTFKVHVKSHLEKGKNLYQCKICTKSFSTKNNLRIHEKTHSEERFHCEICSKYYKTERSLKTHERNFHKQERQFSKNLSTHHCKTVKIENYNEDESDIPEAGIKNNLNINEENIKFEMTTKNLLDEDITPDIKPSLKLIPGTEIQEGTEAENAMIKEEKDEPNNVSDANHLKVCCKNLFDCENSCGQHQNTDKEKKQFICRICSKSFKRKDLLTKHEKIHTGKKSHHCKFCSKSFLKRGDLAVHERVHTGEKPFLCKICSASFRQQAHLRTHERTHSGEKSFVCKLCLKSFAYRSQLKNHEKIHTETFNSVERLDEDDFNIPEEKDVKNDLSIHEDSIKIEFTSEDVGGGDITVDEKPFELNPGILAINKKKDENSTD